MRVDGRLWWWYEHELDKCKSRTVRPNKVISGIGDPSFVTHTNQWHCNHFPRSHLTDFTVTHGRIATFHDRSYIIGQHCHIPLSGSKKTARSTMSCTSTTLITERVFPALIRINRAECAAGGCVYS